MQYCLGWVGNKNLNFEMYRLHEVFIIPIANGLYFGIKDANKCFAFIDFKERKFVDGYTNSEIKFIKGAYRAFQKYWKENESEVEEAINYNQRELRL